MSDTDKKLTEKEVREEYRQHRKDKTFRECWPANNDSFSLPNNLVKALSLLITFNPIPDSALADTHDLPEPGPPARKNALNIAGS